MRETLTRVATGAVAAVVAVAAFGACGTGGPKKVVVNDAVCANARFVRLEAKKTHRIILDNTTFTEGQTQFTLRLDNFPLVIKGEVPPNSQIGDPYSTVVLIAKPGEEKQVDVVPTLTGSFKAQCSVIVQGRSVIKPLPFEIVP
jgi:hypothetical protein